MKIIDLNEHHQPLYLLCLEDWSEEMKEAGNHKEIWYSRMKEKGLRVKLALEDNGIVGGMIQYAPIEHSIVEGKDLYFIFCIWVHGHKQGRGDFRGRGMGQALLRAAEEDVRALGSKGIVAWGLRLPVWMKASWFKRNGYRVVDKQGMQALVWKPFTNDAVPPKWIRQVKAHSLVPGKVNIVSFHNGWCPAQNIVVERARRVAQDRELENKVAFQEIDTFDPVVFREWGIADALFVDNKQVRTGPPPSYARIYKLVKKRTRRLIDSIAR